MRPQLFQQIKKEYDGFWKILIVDDEENVHTITKTVLNGIVFENKELMILSAYSAYEAKEILKAIVGKRVKEKFSSKVFFFFSISFINFKYFDCFKRTRK